MMNLLTSKGVDSDSSRASTSIHVKRNTSQTDATVVSANQSSVGVNSTSATADSAPSDGHINTTASKPSAFNVGKHMNFSPGSQEKFLQKNEGPFNVLPRENAVPGKLQQPMKIDRNTQISGTIMSLVGARDYWHKFIVLGGAVHERSLILKTVLNSPYPTEFIPVLYRIEAPHVTFLAQGCTSAVAKLFHCRFKLMLDGYNTADKLISLEIIVCFSHISVLALSLHDSLNVCVNKRYDNDTKTLDLSNFPDDPDLLDIFYCPLWLPKVFSFVLLRAKALGKTITRMCLNKNELTTVKGQSFWEDFSSIKILDLSENKLDTAYCLMPLKALKLKEIILDKNPLCAQYSSGESYIREVQSFLPTLRKLDGVFLYDRDMPYWHSNFVVSTDGTEFVDQFLERYFTIFDSENRHWLQGMYHEEACFSLSINYLGGQSTSNTARLTHYPAESRNLLKISDYAKSLKLISHGDEDVIAALCRLPKTEHDPFSFTVDLVQYSGNYVVLTVTGVYREPLMENEVDLCFFNRTFVLIRVEDLQYQICNEILFISNATTKQAQDSFKFSRPSPCLTRMALTVFEQVTDAERKMMTECMSELTEMNPRWARKCLEESKWKFREALQVFTELLKMDKIPAEAFVKV